jgi:hypothetical protein
MPMDASNTVVKNLTCGGLNIGGGSSLLPEGPTPDGSQSRFDLSCSGSACSITPFTTAPAVNTAAPEQTSRYVAEKQTDGQRVVAMSPMPREHSDNSSDNDRDRVAPAVATR